MRKKFGEVVVWCAWLLLAVLLPTKAADAAPRKSLDVAELLNQGGVRLLVVDLYASWCEPCKRELPKWKRIQQEYGDKGVRIVVVRTMDRTSRKEDLPFEPDYYLTDDEGETAEVLLGGPVKEGMPAAFLWSWQKNQLKRAQGAGAADKIETAIQAYLAIAPRVTLDAGPGVGAALVRAMETELTTSGKLEVTSDERVRAQLERERRRQAGSEQYADDKCEPGKALPPNSLLMLSKVDQDGAPFLSVSAHGIERGCLLSGAVVPWRADVNQLAREAVDKLLERFKRQGPPEGFEGPTVSRAEVALPAPARRQDVIMNPEDLDWRPKSANPTIVRFESKPNGARVELDGGTLCAAAPCTKSVQPGLHVVRMILPKHETRAERVRIDSDTDELTWKLESNTTRVRFDVRPAGARVEVDEKPFCDAAPCSGELLYGKHQIRISANKYLTKNEFVEIRGSDQVVTSELATNAARVSIETGAASGVPIVVDGEVVGRSPVSLELEDGPHTVEIKDLCYEPARAEITVERGISKSVPLKGVQKMAGLLVEFEDPRGEVAQGDVFLDGTNVGRTFKMLTVPACAKQLDVIGRDGTSRMEISLQPRQEKTVKAKVNSKPESGYESKHAFAFAGPVRVYWGGGTYTIASHLGYRYTLPLRTPSIYEGRAWVPAYDLRISAGLGLLAYDGPCRNCGESYEYRPTAYSLAYFAHARNSLGIFKYNAALCDVGVDSMFFRDSRNGTNFDAIDHGIAFECGFVSNNQGYKDGDWWGVALAFRTGAALSFAEMVWNL